MSSYFTRHKTDAMSDKDGRRKCCTTNREEIRRLRALLAEREAVIEQQNAELRRRNVTIDNLTDVLAGRSSVHTQQPVPSQSSRSSLSVRPFSPRPRRETEESQDSRRSSVTTETLFNQGPGRRGIEDLRLNTPTPPLRPGSSASEKRKKSRTSPPNVPKKKALKQTPPISDAERRPKPKLAGKDVTQIYHQCTCCGKLALASDRNMGRHYNRHHQNLKQHFDIRRDPDRFYITTSNPTDTFPDDHMRPLIDSELQEIFGLNDATPGGRANWLTFREESLAASENEEEQTQELETSTKRKESLEHLRSIQKHMREKKAMEKTASESRSARRSPSRSTADALMETAQQLAGQSGERMSSPKRPTSKKTGRTYESSDEDEPQQSSSHPEEQSWGDEDPRPGVDPRPPQVEQQSEEAPRPETTPRKLALDEIRTALNESDSDTEFGGF